MKNEKENKNLPENQQSNTGKSGSKKDIGNDLHKDAVGKMGSNNPTPQARTDNEQKNQRQ
ncbi:hypothetical protein K3G39_09780 [Pontibacter sp. HSC-14F20]|uniref:hypothetical protein n=1 Tax=Pontibacter sp. HSC-14F20 TaxID=2864136 RepID=UPI001C73C3E9|nr:hypothetical protein [Pontibacter sp. HSC-14F20]MBX0333528.1 hypothetical protein [Pontibacter sp. HSC-14F20]